MPVAPPVTGLGGVLRVRRIHPFANAPDDTDPLTVRLLFLLRSHPDLVRFQADDLASLDAQTKALLVAEIDDAFLSKPVPEVLPADG